MRLNHKSVKSLLEKENWQWALRAEAMRIEFSIQARESSGSWEGEGEGSYELWDLPEQREMRASARLVGDSVNSPSVKYCSAGYGQWRQSAHAQNHDTSHC